MLRFFSKFQRSSKIVLLIFSAVLLLGMILFYVPNSQLGNSPLVGSRADDGTVIAKVGGQEITLKEFRDQLLSTAQVYAQGRGVDASLVRAMKLDQQVLDRLIDERLMLSEADKYGFVGTDQEVSEAIIRTFTDPDTGKFIGKEEYLRRLRLNGQAPEDYERIVRNGFAANKMRTYLASGVQVADKEVEEAYKNDNTKVEVIYATIDKDKIKDKPKPTDQEMQAYYDGHKDEFKATEPVRKVEYIFIPTDKVTVELTDEVLKAEYEDKKQKEPRVSIIKLNIATPADDATVQKKVAELKTRAQGAPGGQPEDFAALAKGNSQDASASGGGDIGWITKNPNSKDWRQRAFNLAVGSIEGPFKEGSSWYLMKVTEERDVPFERMKPTLVAGAKNRRAYAKANEIADKAYELFTENKDLRKTAETIAAEMKIKPEDLIRSTPYFKKGDTLPDIGSNPTFEKHVEELKKGDIADKIGIPNGIAVPRLIDIIEGGVQLTFDQARNQVETKLQREKDLNIVQQTANDYLTKAKTADELKALLTKDGIEVKADANNLTGVPFSSLQVTQQIRTVVLATKQNEVAKAPVKTGAGSYIVFAATKRTEADMSKFADQKTALRMRLEGERGSLVYDAYVKASRKRYEDAGKLWIDNKKIDEAVNSLNPNQLANQ
ncbi:MAG: SurA N-terminal domain-containing protein [Blastocatellia bacterium]|nr:SurA N-terminal domain-containing protein [Blastocatellia bacterium]